MRETTMIELWNLQQKFFFCIIHYEKFAQRDISIIKLIRLIIDKVS